MKEIKTFADESSMDDVQAFVEEELSLLGCDPVFMNEISLVVEEVYINIIHYAYEDKGGDAVVGLDADQASKTLTLSFTDKGPEFNPLLKEEPDLNEPADTRPIGGLGIFLVRKIMDECAYERKDGCNVLTIKKAWK